MLVSASFNVEIPTKSFKYEPAIELKRNSRKLPQETSTPMRALRRILICLLDQIHRERLAVHGELGRVASLVKHVDSEVQGYMILLTPKGSAELGMMRVEAERVPCVDLSRR